MAKILIAEDEKSIADGLREMFENKGHDPCVFYTFSDAAFAATHDRFDLFILDNLLPDGDGLTLCRLLRGKNIATPILFLTACDEEEQIVEGLDAGADDYITKPFRIREFLSRVNALLRRQNGSPAEKKEISLNIDYYTVTKNGTPVAVTPIEFRLLHTLMKNEGIIVTRKVLLELIWDDNGDFIDNNTLSVHISRLRDKIGHEHIVTVRGIGYRWED